MAACAPSPCSVATLPGLLTPLSLHYNTWTHNWVFFYFLLYSRVMFRAYTSIRSGVLQTKARMCMQVHMRWLSMRLGGQVHRRGLYCTRTCGRRRNMRGLSSSEFGAWFSSGCGIPSCKIYLCCKMYLCACLWVLGSCRGHLVGVDNCCDVGCILGKWQFGSHEVCKWLLIWGVIMYCVCVGTCNDLCEALA